MFGDNPKRKTSSGDGTILEVKSIFKTIQGEGPFIGTPAVFIRLGGCNLACNFCDTDFEDFVSLHIDTILKTVTDLSNNIVKLVVITGGEPFRQPIELLCNALVNLCFITQIETNGTLYRKLPDSLSIICSPKAGSRGYSQIRDDLLPHITALKFIVAKHVPLYNQVPELGQTKYNIPVFIQPMDQCDAELNQENQNLAIQIALQRGYRLSLQTHKILGIE